MRLKDDLRRLSKAEAAAFQIDTASVVAGYRDLLANAPSRASRGKTYLSATRTGVTSSGDSSTRREEHLAAALFARRELFFATGERVTLADYQFPLKARQSDASLGKIDLLGVLDDGTLGIIELKTAENREDRRIGLLEALIYAAIVEANIEQIACEVTARLNVKIVQARPRIFVLAPAEFFDSARSTPSPSETGRLAAELSDALPIVLRMAVLHDAKLFRMGLNGQPPQLRGHAFLTGSDISLFAGAPPRDAYGAFLRERRKTFWNYAHAAFATAAAPVFDPRHAEPDSSPVFVASEAGRNVPVPPHASLELNTRIVQAIPPAERHRWFGSMASSQALAQSVFAVLRELGRLSVLAGLEAEDGHPAFFETYSGHTFELEHRVQSLNEPRPTSVDVFVNGPARVAVEAKFTETEFGRCSRPALRPKDANYERDHCDGSYSIQRNREQKCSLSQLGIRYWEYVPQLFAWPSDIEHRPCPLGRGYQLMRNILAACVQPEGGVDTERCHALVLYDKRNPAFRPGGAAHLQWWSVVCALRFPRVLRRLTWQRLAGHLRQFPELDWLTRGLHDKYGF